MAIKENPHRIIRTEEQLAVPPGQSTSVLYQMYVVWLRHVQVYATRLISNILPTLIEPLYFLGMGLGMSYYIDPTGEFSYIGFISTGLLISSSMFTSAYECTYSTFSRLKHEQVYFVMLTAPINPWTLFLGELLWAGTKGAFFSLAILSIVTVSGILPLSPAMIIVPFLGFLNALMFGGIGLFFTSFAQSINHFGVFFSIFLSPMYFLSGVIFPLEQLPSFLRGISEVLPLTHSVRFLRTLFAGSTSVTLLWDMSYIVIFITIFAGIGIWRLKRMLIN